ncbi:hypothetical protein LCL95_01545 [Bacillus timonensis]|nr:hypothetical protein [Bacillus timonensis]
MRFRLPIFVSLLLFISACTTEKNYIEDFYQNVPQQESTFILHELKLKNGILLLYQDKTGYRQAFYSKGKQVWSLTANAELKPSDGISWLMNNDPTIPLAMFGGVLTDDQIQKVVVKQKTLVQEASILDSGKGYRVWYALFDRLENPSPGEPDPLKIEAFDLEGDILWKNGVYEDGLFSGRTDK